MVYFGVYQSIIIQLREYKNRSICRGFVPLVAVLVGVVFLLAACSKKQEVQTITLPPTPVLGAQQSWAVVNSQRLRLRENPTTTSPALITLWKGYVVEVVKRSPSEETIGDMTDYWYYVNYKGLRGWVYGFYLTMYDSKQGAEDAVKVSK
jgi:hypothetical protein